MRKYMCRKGIVIGIIILFVGASVVPLIGGTNVEKHNSIDDSVSFMGFNSRGDILYVGGSGPNNYSTIQEGINAASDGDTVFVYDDSSPYYENVFVYKSINLMGENRDTTVIDGDESGDVVCISADMVNISGFTIQNSGRNIFDRKKGVKVSSAYTIIHGNDIKNNQLGVCLRNKT